jgi:uncharacterized phage-like protein YoqJ
MKLFVIGDRINRLGGPNNKRKHKKLYNLLEKEILQLNPTLVYSNMSVGVEQWTAEIAYKNRIPYIAAIPFKEHYKLWPQHVQERYQGLLRRAIKVIEVDRQPFYISHSVDPEAWNPAKYISAGQWVCDQLDRSSDRLIQISRTRKSPRINRISEYFLNNSTESFIMFKRFDVDAIFGEDILYNFDDLPF